ncbi:hypothetical protein [Pararhizobium sp. A13]|uniref:hypothetical protein n=1 Tax=Pararhizobium sp. A13 TaxID=3133975 RepID=UPI00324D9855
MTRKDYELIAAAFKRQLAMKVDKAEHDVLSDLAEDLAGEFLALNPRFDVNRFLKACGLS